MNKVLLTLVILSTLAMIGCETNRPNIAIIPGAEAEMVAMCAANGGFVRGTITKNDRYEGQKIATVAAYRNLYVVECENGAKIERYYEIPVRKR